MNIIEKLQNFFSQYTAKQVRILLLGYLGIVGVILSGFVWWHYQSISDYQMQYKNLRRDRAKLLQQLGLYQYVQKQKEKVDKMLAQNTDFYLKKYFQDTALQAGIEKQNITQATSKDRKLDNGYDEEVLHITFRATTEHIVKFLQVVEQTTRVYIKYLDMTKASQDAQMVTLQLELATLQQKQGTQTS